MEKTVNIDSSKAHHKSLANTPLVEVSKTINAPIADVWKAWENPDLVKQWWGPKDYTAPVAKHDFRIDGKYVYSMESPAGEVMWDTGIFKEINPEELIVCTDQFSDAVGNVITPQEAGMEGDWGDSDTFIFSVRFDKVDDDHTKLQLVHEGIPASMHDDCVNGWSSSLDKLKQLVEKN